LKNNDFSDEIVASVGDKYLYKKDLLPLYNKDIKGEDSLTITRNFIEIWARKQIILQKAALNLPLEKEIALEKMVEEYRNDLFINSYKEALVTQNLDTIISNETIRKFYIANQNIFRLNEELIQYKYICFDSEIKDTKLIKEQFLATDNKESVEEILGDELKYKTIQLNDSVWNRYVDFLKFIPEVKKISKNKILNNDYFFELHDSVYTHFIRVNKYLNRNEIAPIEYVKPVIKQMILHQKKLSYIKNLEDQLIDEAIQNNTYKTK
jgi:hypothetical protein